MPKVPYPYEVNDKLVTGNGSLIPICSLSNRSLLSSLTVHTIRNYNLGPNETEIFSLINNTYQTFSQQHLKFVQASL